MRKPYLYTFCGEKKKFFYHYLPLSVEKRKSLFIITVQPHYNTPHYSAVFNITRPCHGSQINYFVICLL